MFNYNFLSPDQKTMLATNLPPENREWSIARRILIKNLVERAKSAGVHFHFSTKVLNPLIEKNEIIGIIYEQNGQTQTETIKAKLIIDNAGLHTPIRSNLPDSFNITQKLCRGQIFYAYRGYYNAIQPVTKFLIYMGYKYQPGIAWVNHAPGCADILIGRIDPFKQSEIDEIIQDLRTKSPEVGKQLKHGGYVAQIPVRRPLNLLIADRYVIIGDAACMASPMNGSGVGPAMKAGKILADTISSLNRESTQYSAKDLYPYQKNYFQEIGAAYAQLEVLKNWMMTADMHDVDFAFANGLIAAEDIERSIKGLPADSSMMTMVTKALKGILRLDILLRLKSMLDLGKSVQKHYVNPPEQYDLGLIKKWRNKADAFFLEYEKRLQNQNPKL
jgi:flavin-dependent dehydrogenase